MSRTRLLVFSYAASSLATVALAGAGLAADLAPTPQIIPIVPHVSQSFVSELRAGAFAHDPFSPEAGGVADFNGEMLFAKLPIDADARWAFLVPRPHLGGTANFTGKTSHIYAGFTWDYDITSAIFLEASFGGSLNNGSTGLRPDHNALGCNGLFRESGSLGYRLDSHWSVMASIEHTSNAGLCNYNRGLTNFGGRVGYTF